MLGLFTTATLMLGLGTGPLMSGRFTAQTAVASTIHHATVRPLRTAAATIQLTMWQQVGGGYMRAMFDRVLDRYMKMHPNVHITETPVTDNTKILAAIAGGSPPDIIDLGLGITVPEWAQRGVLLPLDGYIKRSHLDRNQFISNAWLPLVYKGQTYGLPYEDFDVELIWNRQLFQRAGLDPNRAPSTLDELTTYAAKLTHKAAGKITQLGFLPDYPGIANFQVVTLQDLGWLFGGDWYDAKTHQITADAPANVRALTWEVSLYQRLGVQAMANFEQSAGSYLTPQDPFEAGKLAMMYDGQWQLVFAPVNKPSIDKVMDAGPFPAPAGLSSRTGTTYIDTNPQIIPTGAKHPDAAWDFLKWEVTDPWSCSFFGQVAGGLPHLKNCTFPRLRDPRYQMFWRESAGPNAHVWPRLPVSQMYQTKLGAAESAAIHQSQSPAAALHDLTQTIQQALEALQH
jgi:ABC-type glycerol-3-phosphate transport system substrate-binding protein